MKYIESWMIALLYIIFASLSVMLGYFEFKTVAVFPLILCFWLFILSIPLILMKGFRDFYISYYDSAEVWGWQHKFKLVDIRIESRRLFLVRTTRRIPWYRKNHISSIFKKQEEVFSCFLKENLPSNPTRESLSNYNLIEPLTYQNYMKEKGGIHANYDSLSFYNHINGIIAEWYLMNHQRMEDSDFSEKLKEYPTIWTQDNSVYGHFESFWGED